MVQKSLRWKYCASLLLRLPLVYREYKNASMTRFIWRMTIHTRRTVRKRLKKFHSFHWKLPASSQRSTSKTKIHKIFFLQMWHQNENLWTNVSYKMRNATMDEESWRKLQIASCDIDVESETISYGLLDVCFLFEIKKKCWGNCMIF